MMKRSVQTTVLFIAMVFLITSCKSSDDEGAMMEEEKTIAGNYNGSWSSTNPLSTYSGLSISAKITATSDPNIFNGEFFFVPGFVSCCNSGANDGTLKFVVEGNTITEFTYTDILPDCNGIFTGMGTISANGRIRIEFTGSDCEGPHTDGVLILN